MIYTPTILGLHTRQQKAQNLQSKDSWPGNYHSLNVVLQSLDDQAVELLLSLAKAPLLSSPVQTLQSWWRAWPLAGLPLPEGPYAPAHLAVSIAHYHIKHLPQSMVTSIADQVAPGAAPAKLEPQHQQASPQTSELPSQFHPNHTSQARRLDAKQYPPSYLWISLGQCVHTSLVKSLLDERQGRHPPLLFVPTRVPRPCHTLPLYYADPTQI
eukprot:jgi/Picsp_1/5564/NSC_02923-R1_---NA---